MKTEGNITEWQPTPVDSWSYFDRCKSFLSSHLVMSLPLNTTAGPHQWHVCLVKEQVPTAHRGNQGQGCPHPGWDTESRDTEWPDLSPNAQDSTGGPDFTAGGHAAVASHRLCAPKPRWQRAGGEARTLRCRERWDDTRDFWTLSRAKEQV